MQLVEWHQYLVVHACMVWWWRVRSDLRVNDLWHCVQRDSPWRRSKEMADWAGVNEADSDGSEDSLGVDSGPISDKSWNTGE
jgi:hypothetical protein